MQLGADGFIGRPGQHLVSVQKLVLSHVDPGQSQIQVQFLGIGRDGGDQGVFGLGEVSRALIGLGQLQRQFRVVGGDDTGPAVVGDSLGIIAIGQGGVGPVHEKLLGDIGAEDQQEQKGSGQQQHHQQDGDDDFQQTLHSAAPIQYKLHIIIPAWWKRVKLRCRNAKRDAALLCGVPDDDYFLSERGI